MYVASRKLCVVVDSNVKNWYCTLSCKNCHLTFLCLPHHFLSFWQFLRSLSIILILVNRQYHFNLKRMGNCVTFPSSLKSIAYFSFSASLMWEISKQLKVLSCFSIPKFDSLLLYLMKRSASPTYNISLGLFTYFYMCVLFITKLLRLVGRLGTRKPV